MRKIKLYDTTLRDGAQSEGITYSLIDKVRIVEKLDSLGLDYIEGGWPSSNPKDMQFFKRMAKKRLKSAQLVAFGSTRRAGISARQDKNLQGILKSGAKVVTLFGKTWPLHVRNVLRTTLHENLKMIFESVQFLVKNKKVVFYDAEHFFDAYYEDSDYAFDCLRAAEKAGASFLVLCDTNGGMLPQQIVRVVNGVKQNIKTRLGIHCHNDAGLAVANSLLAVDSGCDMVQGTINGYGERCGNADLIPIIANLKLKMGFACIGKEGLRRLSEVSYFVSEISNMRHMINQPYVGDSAFAHKGGVHINAMMKESRSYEHVDPGIVGNRRRILVSELAGKSGILLRAKELKFDLTKDNPQTKKVYKLLQSLELKGYHFEAAEASFELLLKKALGHAREYFHLEGFRVVVNKEANKKITSEAIIKLRVKNKLEHTAAAGDGPVNALDNALRKALKDFYPTLAKMHLSDFKVRILDEKAGTAATTRVIIQSQDEKEDWSTIGVSENIMEASWQALTDSIEYKLLK
ncbi:MAG: citramalate synthase, partial [Candidatus Omnitrophota bacterium]